MATRIDFHPSLCEPFRIFMRNHEPVNLSLRARPPANLMPAPTLLLSGRSTDGDELWSILYVSDHLFVSGMSSLSESDLGPAYETFGISYNPIAGSLAVTCGRKVQTFRVRCSWAQPDMEKANWHLWIGRPLDVWHGFDNMNLAPVGWKFEGNIFDGASMGKYAPEEEPAYNKEWRKLVSILIPGTVFEATNTEDSKIADWMNRLVGETTLREVAPKKPAGRFKGVVDMLRGEGLFSPATFSSVPAEEIRSVLRELGIDHLTGTDEEEEEIASHWDAVVTLGAVSAQEIIADAATISKFAAELLEEHLKWAAERRQATP